jgi:drug/metabolite transporter (DMT)-like permease
LQANIRPLDLLAFLLIGVLWGLNWPAVKFMLTEMPPLTIRAVSFTSAALILAVIVTLLKQPLRLRISEAIPVATVGIFLICGFNVLTSFGQVLLETSKAAIIAYTMPSLTALLAAIYLGERVGIRLVLALTIAMAGLGILASENLHSLIEQPIGPAIMMLAALSWAIGTVALKSRTWRLPPLSLTVWFFAFSSLAVWPLVLVVEPPWEQNWPSMPVVATLAFHILGPAILCYVLWTVLVARLPATIVAISALTAPVVGVLSSVLFLGDIMNWQKGLALTAIILSITATLYQPRKPTNPDLR